MASPLTSFKYISLTESPTKSCTTSFENDLVKSAMTRLLCSFSFLSNSSQASFKVLSAILRTAFLTPCSINSFDKFLLILSISLALLGPRTGEGSGTETRRKLIMGIDNGLVALDGIGMAEVDATG